MSAPKLLLAATAARAAAPAHPASHHPAAQLRCQLVCKAWRLALDPRRWPLCQLELEACVDRDRSPLAAPAALWVQRMRPGVRDLRIELSGYDGYAGFVEEGKASVTWDSPAVQAAHGALLALQPLEVRGHMGWDAAAQVRGGASSTHCLGCSVSPCPPHVRAGGRLRRDQAACGRTHRRLIERWPHLAPPPPPQSLHSLSLTAPFPVLERFLQALGRFTGLRRLELRAEMRYMDDEDETIRWDTQALLLPELLQPLPPQLEGLTVANFYGVGLEEELPADDTAAAPAAGAAAASAAAVGNAGAAGSQAPAPTPLPPGLSWLSIRNARLALLDMPLPGLAAVTIDECSQVCLKGDRLQLPQLTSLQLCCSCPANAVRFGAMPALAQLACSGRFRPSDSFAALQRLASLDLILMGGSLQNAGAMVKAVAPSLRSLRAEVRPWHNHHLVQQAAATLEAAGASQLTRLVS